MSGALAGRSAAIAEPARTHVSATPATTHDRFSRFIGRAPFCPMLKRPLTVRDDIHTSTGGCSSVTDRKNGFRCDIFVGAGCAARRKLIPAMPDAAHARAQREHDERVC